MSERWANSTSASGVSLANIMKLAAKIAKPKPIMAFRGTSADLAAAVQAERPPTSPLLWGIAPPDPFPGLDVVEEGEWTYIGTSKQLAEARERWGSFTAARLVGERKGGVE